MQNFPNYWKVVPFLCTVQRTQACRNSDILNRYIHRSSSLLSCLDHLDLIRWTFNTLWDLIVEYFWFISQRRIFFCLCYGVYNLIIVFYPTLELVTIIMIHYLVCTTKAVNMNNKLCPWLSKIIYPSCITFTKSTTCDLNYITFFVFQTDSNFVDIKYKIYNYPYAIDDQAHKYPRSIRLEILFITTFFLNSIIYLKATTLSTFFCFKINYFLEFLCHWPYAKTDYWFCVWNSCRLCKLIPQYYIFFVPQIHFECFFYLPLSMVHKKYYIYKSTCFFSLCKTKNNK